jgi:hypothetical protein
LREFECLLAANENFGERHLDDLLLSTAGAFREATLPLARFCLTRRRASGAQENAVNPLDLCCRFEKLGIDQIPGRLIAFELVVGSLERKDKG